MQRQGFRFGTTGVGVRDRSAKSLLFLTSSFLFIVYESFAKIVLSLERKQIGLGSFLNLSRHVKLGKETKRDDRVDKAMNNN